VILGISRNNPLRVRVRTHRSGHAFTKKREGCVKAFLNTVVPKFWHLVQMRCQRIATECRPADVPNAEAMTKSDSGNPVAGPLQWFNNSTF
jgi:hypothetical protein